MKNLLGNLQERFQSTSRFNQCMHDRRASSHLIGPRKNHLMPKKEDEHNDSICAIQQHWALSVRCIQTSINFGKYLF